MGRYIATRVWNGSILLFVGVAVILLSTITASAMTVTDSIDDVYDAVSETVVSRPNIDITTVTYELSGDTVTLTMTVKGNIVDSEYILYTICIWTNGTRFPGYVAQYTNGTGYVLKDATVVDSEVSVSQGNTIIFTFTRSDSTEIGEIAGSALENPEDFSNTWTDYAPNDFSQWYSGDGDDDTGGGSGSRYYIDLGEYWPDLEGYTFSCSIPEGYEVSNVTLYYYGTITLELSGPPVFEIFLPRIVVDEPADYLSIDISWWTLEGDFIFEEMLEYSCGGPSPSLSNMSNRKTSGYDDYYLKSIGCYYCPEPEVEGLFFEASIPGVIFLNESLKYPALEYCLGYWSAFSCYLGEVNPDQYFTIGETPINEKKSEVVNHIFSSIQITPSKEPGSYIPPSPTENESYIPPDKKEEIPVNEIVIVTSAAAGVAVLLGFLATEWGKYKFLSFLPLLLGPLYLRTVREEVFDNQKRLCMYNHIAEKQPVVYTEIKKTCNLSDGEINWHAHMMIRLDLIKTERKGFHLFFYLAESPRLSPEEFIRLTDVQKSVLDLIVKKPGITQAEIVEKIGLKQQNISYNLLKLEKKGKIRVEKKGTIKFYYIIKKDSSSI